MTKLALIVDSSSALSSRLSYLILHERSLDSIVCLYTDDTRSRSTESM
jgi:hypothetical protein